MKVGFASRDITPTPPLRLAGFGDRVDDVLAVHDALIVQAVAIDELILVSFDLLALSPDIAARIREAVRTATGADSVVTVCSHTHSGPCAMTAGELLGWPIPSGYIELLIDRAVEAAVEAVGRRSPAEASFARFALPQGTSMNRRGNPYEPVGCALRLGDVTLANVGVHPVALGSGWMQVSSDWVGPFRETLEATDGNAVLLPRCFGDVNPPELDGDYEKTRALGERLAGAVTGADFQPTQGPVGVVRDTSVEVVPADTQLAELIGGVSQTVPIVEWEIAGIRIRFIPGEPFHALESDIGAGNVMLVGNAPEWHGYLPQPFGLGYEEMVSYGPAAVETILGAVRG